MADVTAFGKFEILDKADAFFFRFGGAPGCMNNGKRFIAHHNNPLRHHRNLKASIND